MRYTTIHANQHTLKMAKIALGAPTFGSDISQKEAFAYLDQYAAAGGNVIDTARVYADWIANGHSASEKTIGAWLKARGNRKDMIIVTKGGHPMINTDVSRLSKTDLISDLNESLQALDVAQVDVYLLHRDDEKIPVEEIMDALHEFVSQGKVKVLGVSNWRASRILAANEYAKRAQITLLSISQIQWSYIDCRLGTWGDTTMVGMDEAEYVLYEQMDLTVMAFSAQAKGFITKAIQCAGKSLPQGIQRFDTPENRDKAKKAIYIAKAKGCTAGAISLAYLTSNPVNCIAIVGASSTQQLAETLDGADVALSKEEMKQLL